MTSRRCYRFIAGTAVAIAALSSASDARAYVMDAPPAPTPEVTAPPGPDNPQARTDWWTVTAPWSVTKPTPTAPAAGQAPAKTAPARSTRPAEAESPRRALPAPSPRRARPARRVPALVAATRTGTWFVADGETLDGIARANGTTWQHLQRMNEHRHPSLTDNPGLILPGWHLTVPQ